VSDIVRLLWLAGAIGMATNVVRGFTRGTVVGRMGSVRRDENDYAFWLYMVISAAGVVACLFAAVAH
jgi:hypothetical protein